MNTYYHSRINGLSYMTPQTYSNYRKSYGISFDDIKKKNNYFTVKVPKLKNGDVILFEDEDNIQQGNIVVDIFTPPGTKNIIVEYKPEFTKTTATSMFHYDMKKFRHKYL